MNGIAIRDYNCKNEELPVICGFVANSLKRDLADFTAFSPVFSPEYVSGYEARIEEVKELVMPRSETVELKLLTEKMYAAMEGLVMPINHLTGYLQIAGKAIPLSATDFCLTALRKGVRRYDAENVLKNIREVLLNVTKYHDQLVAAGMNGNITSQLETARESLDNDNQRKQEIRSNRMAIAQGNLDQLNGLYDQFVSITKIGKILYKQTNLAKTKDYTFTHLLKQVRRVEKPEDEAEKEAVSQQPQEPAAEPAAE